MADKECPNCGRKTREEASFCLGCGQSFGSAAPSRPAVERRPAPESRPAPERRPPPERETPPSRYDPERRDEPATPYVPRPPATGDRLSIEQRRDIARRRVIQEEARVQRTSGWRWFRPQGIELVMAVAVLTTGLFLALMVGLFISNAVDWLTPDNGDGSPEFVAAADFDAGRLLTVGMTQKEIDRTAFDGVAGWRAVYLNEAAARDATVSAGDVHLTTQDADPVSSAYYMLVVFPESGTGAVPVAAFLRQDDKAVFHVMSMSCDDAIAILAGTTRGGPPPGSIC